MQAGPVASTSKVPIPAEVVPPSPRTLRILPPKAVPVVPKPGFTEASKPAKPPTAKFTFTGDLSLATTGWTDAEKLARRRILVLPKVIRGNSVEAGLRVLRPDEDYKTAGPLISCISKNEQASSFFVTSSDILLCIQSLIDFQMDAEVWHCSSRSSVLADYVFDSSRRR